MFGLALWLATNCPIDAVNDECELRAAIEFIVDINGVVPGFSMTETKALLQITARDESNWSMGAVGDSGRAHCALQVWGSRPRSATECVKAALQKMRESAALCADEPLAQYAGGCHVPKARRISHRRVKEARSLSSKK